MIFCKPIVFLIVFFSLFFTSAAKAQKRSGLLLELRGGGSFRPGGSTSGIGSYPFHLLDDQITAHANVGFAAGYKHQMIPGIDLSLAGVLDLYLGGDVVPVLSAEPKLTVGTGRARPFIFLNFGKALYNDPIASGGTVRHGGGPGGFNTYADAAQERIDKNALLWGAGLGIHVRIMRYTGLMAGLKLMNVPTDIVVEKSVQYVYGGPYTITQQHYERDFKRITLFIGLTL